MVHKIKPIVLFILILINSACSAQKEPILVGAEQPDSYLSKLKEKNVALMVNQTSRTGELHLVDFLLENKIHIKKVFAVEHGFRGSNANGEEFNDSIDIKTGLPIISLYGSKKKPSEEDLNDIDVIVFDIQDVGCRFYTYISSLYYLMEASAENKVKVIILDRPNPNGDYIAGPVLNMQLKSFVGIMPIPVVHGCTVGELALMINGEKWLPDGIQCNLEVVKMKNYDHSMRYSLPIKPSPNLPTDLAVRLYPSLCFFEATNVSIGRGTAFPFQVIGYPDCKIGNLKFTPISIPGVSIDPTFEGIECNGIDLRNLGEAPYFTLHYFIQFANEFSNKEDFWKSKRWIELLSGSTLFYDQINKGYTEREIMESWQAELNKYKRMRKSYLLYPDFE